MRRIGLWIFWWGMIGFGGSYLFRLQLPFAIGMNVVLIASMWCYGQYDKQEKQTVETFTQVNQYLEQLLYAFRKKGVILSSLKDVEGIFANGEMKNSLCHAIEYMENTYGQNYVEQQGLKMIERDYPSRQVVRVHQFMLNQTQIGGDASFAIQILLTERERQEKEKRTIKERCNHQMRNILIAILLSFAVCMMTPLLCQNRLEAVSITSHVVYQWSTCLMLAADFAVLLVAKRCLAGLLMEKDSHTDREVSQKQYQKVINFSMNKERKKSICYALPVIAAGVCGICMKKWVLAGVGLLVGMLLFKQHKLDYALAKKSVMRQIRIEFPEWMLEMLLLLQHENVFNSIEKSIEHTSGFLKDELMALHQNLTIMPESNLPYAQFLSRFEMAEITSAMGMLYSFSEGSGSEPKEQIKEILLRNEKWMQETRAMQWKDKEAVFYLLFLTPALIGAMKMIADMTLLLMSFLVMMK